MRGKADLRAARRREAGPRGRGGTRIAGLHWRLSEPGAGRPGRPQPACEEWVGVSAPQPPSSSAAGAASSAQTAGSPEGVPDLPSVTQCDCSGSHGPFLKAFPFSILVWRVAFAWCSDGTWPPLLSVLLRMRSVVLTAEIGISHKTQGMLVGS